MKSSLLILLSLMSLTLSVTGFSAGWQERAEVKVIKICGSLMKKQTSYDGVQSVFTQTNETGQALRSYFLQSASTPASSQLAGLVQDENLKVCVLGTPSQQKMIDSAPNFYVLEVIF